jgi:hypothetical protein
MTAPHMVVEGVDVDALAAALGACPSVVRVGSGRPGAVATYLPGRRVTGVRLEADRIAVELVARWQCPVATVASEVRQAVAAFAPGRRVDVTITDIELPGEAAARASDAAQPR